MSLRTTWYWACSPSEFLQAGVKIWCVTLCQQCPDSVIWPPYDFFLMRAAQVKCVSIRAMLCAALQGIAMDGIRTVKG